MIQQFKQMQTNKQITKWSIKIMKWQARTEQKKNNNINNNKKRKQTHKKITQKNIQTNLHLQINKNYK